MAKGKFYSIKYMILMCKILKFQEQFSTINQQNPYNIQYKRYQVPYNEKKSNQYKQYKPVNKM